MITFSELNSFEIVGIMLFFFAIGYIITKLLQKELKRNDAWENMDTEDNDLINEEIEDDEEIIIEDEDSIKDEHETEPMDKPTTNGEEIKSIKEVN